MKETATGDENMDYLEALSKASRSLNANNSNSTFEWRNCKKLKSLD
jgi:hypothetical protein